MCICYNINYILNRDLTLDNNQPTNKKMTKEDVFCHIVKLHKLSTTPNLSFDNIVANEIPLISDVIYNQVKNGELEIFNEIPYLFYLKNDITDLYTPNETYLNFLMKLDKSNRILSVELNNFIVSKALKNNLDKSNLDAFDIDKNFKKYINFFDVILKNIKSYEINLSISLSFLLFLNSL